MRPRRIEISSSAPTQGDWLKPSRRRRSRCTIWLGSLTSDDALSTLGRGEAWTAAAEAAAAGAPAPGGAEVAAKTVSAAEPTTTDGYLEKLAKYVPGS
jgi:hypothetical protein